MLCPYVDICLNKNTAYSRKLDATSHVAAERLAPKKKKEVAKTTSFDCSALAQREADILFVHPSVLLFEQSSRLSSGVALARFGYGQCTAKSA